MHDDNTNHYTCMSYTYKPYRLYSHTGAVAQDVVHLVNTRIIETRTGRPTSRLASLTKYIPTYILTYLSHYLHQHYPPLYTPTFITNLLTTYLPSQLTYTTTYLPAIHT